MAGGIIDAWLQHPTAAFLRDPMFASLMRWRGMDERPSPAVTMEAPRNLRIEKLLSLMSLGRSG